ncbi:MAG TPA: VOC family protein [Anaerolineales bacterium]|nr:VOC family protein [Anaerolineales bacterium]
MPTIRTGAINHLTLTVTNRDRSRDFYTQILGFKFLAEVGPKYLLNNGDTFLGLNEAPDPSQAIQEDRFNENRVGLDHVSFNVGTFEDLEKALETLDQMNVPHGEIKDLGRMGICVLAFRDPDNIQLELTASK